MRKALVVGINNYTEISSLYGCVHDAYSVKNALERHSDGTINFSVNLLTASGSDEQVTKRELKDTIAELFSDDSEVALFYFAGHGWIESTGGYLVTSECRDGDDGFSLNDLLTIVNKSTSKNKIIILDSCHSGITGDTPSDGNALLSEGLTILTASSAQQYATEENGSGVFTSLLIDALNGGAANLLGDVTPGSLYAHIDQSLGPWEQRPIFKTNVKNFISLRKTTPPISLDKLLSITDLFENVGYAFQLDPSFEPESESPIKENVEKFKILQSFNRVNLVVPSDAEHMYHAAIHSKSCKLTPLGIHYWNLVHNNRI
ncbi:caspase family protein [Bacillus toyonensis]|uniref:caspase family protein n=1 Tax=Bacillus toyonensis TaxID=155322 RepID=UPI000BEE6850|nr:caspase family protein [Bacillus toyonensis]PED95175.1 peptidase C14 [Bacillus toyonensis]